VGMCWQLMSVSATLCFTAKYHCACSAVVSEPSVYTPSNGQIVLSAEQLANDYVIFHKVLESYPCFRNSRVVGPDIFPQAATPEAQKLIQA